MAPHVTLFAQRNGTECEKVRSCPRLRGSATAVGDGRRLESGNPTAPGTFHLGLLPPGSDPIRGAPPRRTQPSMPRVHHPGCAPRRHVAPRAGNSVPREEGFGFRAPLVPHLARSPGRLPAQQTYLPEDQPSVCKSRRPAPVSAHAQRREAKKSSSNAPLSSARIPSIRSIRWLSRRSWGMLYRDHAAPALGSAAP